MISRDQLIQIRDNSKSLSVPRSTRKTLFKYNLWCPLSKRTVGISPKTTKNYSISKGALLNSRSINGKEDSIHELITDNNLDFLALTETWCTDKSSVSLGFITPPGYTIQHTNRESRVISKDVIRDRFLPLPMAVPQRLVLKVLKTVDRCLCPLEMMSMKT